MSHAHTNNPTAPRVGALSEEQAHGERCALAPGSAPAIDAGCNCPIYDNARGKGWLCSGLYIMRDDCPIHGHRNGELSQPDGEHAGHYPSPNPGDEPRPQRK